MPTSSRIWPVAMPPAMAARIRATAAPNDWMAVGAGLGGTAPAVLWSFGGLFSTGAASTENVVGGEEAAAIHGEVPVPPHERDEGTHHGGDQGGRTDADGDSPIRVCVPRQGGRRLRTGRVRACVLQGRGRLGVQLVAARADGRQAGVPRTGSGSSKKANETRCSRSATPADAPTEPVRPVR